jgi:uncharacterized repeat protein (TIGR03803 family)
MNDLSAIAKFNYPNGVAPLASLIMDDSGNLYGTTLGGGAHGDGTVFKVANDDDTP